MTTLTSPADLKQFTGTAQWFKHQFTRKFLYTDGVKHFAENAGGGAYWFLDIAATEIYVLHKKLGEHFLGITMTVLDGKGDIVVTGGGDNQLFTKHIDFTDCPNGDWKFLQVWDGEHSIMLVPSEY